MAAAASTIYTSDGKTFDATETPQAITQMFLQSQYPYAGAWVTKSNGKKAWVVMTQICRIEEP